MRIRSIGARSIAAAAALTLGVSAGGEIAAAKTGSAPLDSPGPRPVEPPVPDAGQRRVDLAMKDTAFSPTGLDVKLGETIDFVFTNTGKLVHDAFIGDKAAQDQHEEEMREMNDPGGHGGHEGGVTVAPGETGALRHHFDTPGTFEIGCHQPGHYADGMRVIISVGVI